MPPIPLHHCATAGTYSWRFWWVFLLLFVLGFLVVCFCLFVCFLPLEPGFFLLLPCLGNIQNLHFSTIPRCFTCTLNWRNTVLGYTSCCFPSVSLISQTHKDTHIQNGGVGKKKQYKELSTKRVRRGNTHFLTIYVNIICIC